MVPRHFENSKTFLWVFDDLVFRAVSFFFILNFRANVDRDGTSAF